MGGTHACSPCGSGLSGSGGNRVPALAISAQQLELERQFAELMHEYPRQAKQLALVQEWIDLCVQHFQAGLRAIADPDTKAHQRQGMQQALTNLYAVGHFIIAVLCMPVGSAQERALSVILIRRCADAATKIGFTPAPRDRSGIPIIRPPPGPYKYQPPGPTYSQPDHRRAIRGCGRRRASAMNEDDQDREIGGLVRQRQEHVTTMVCCMSKAQRYCDARFGPVFLEIAALDPTYRTARIGRFNGAMGCDQRPRAEPRAQSVASSRCAVVCSPAQRTRAPPSLASHCLLPWDWHVPVSLQAVRVPGGLSETGLRNMGNYLLLSGSDIGLRFSVGLEA